MDTDNTDADSLHMMRAWISPLLAERGVWRVGPKLDCARLPHYCPSRAAPGHAGPTALITADSPTSALILLQTLPSLLLCVQSVGRCDGRGRRGDAELLLDTRHALSPVCHHLVSLLYRLLDLLGGGRLIEGGAEPRRWFLTGVEHSLSWSSR